MNKLLLFFCFNLLFIEISYSQVFVSKAIEGTILLGPKNVNHQKKSVTATHFAKIEAFKISLKNEALVLNQNIQQLEEKRKLRKKDQALLTTYKFDLAKVETEKELVNSLLGDWMATIKRNKTLAALALLDDEECFEIITDKGTYRNDQLEINRVAATENKYEAFIPVSEFSGSYKEVGKWVKKKKSPDCFSQNPEDCYVACYEKEMVEEIAYKVRDMQGNMILMTTEPLGMKCTRDSEMCYTMNKGGKNNKGLQLSLKSKATGEVLELISWRKLDCSEN